MGDDPDFQQIDQFCDITGVSKDEAYLKLIVYNLNILFIHSEFFVNFRNMRITLKKLFKISFLKRGAIDRFFFHWYSLAIQYRTSSSLTSNGGEKGGDDIRSPDPVKKQKLLDANEGLILNFVIFTLFFISQVVDTETDLED